ncbi:hypothetical protein HYC85_017314 [Camellia sinensis]|uniref:Exopolygalacturonase-like n=1 Tax=Camellia sinensis TaxID=4442 RepID=A0A7J7H5P3_CAMSI|nr:hypothetical protein HYC85_017314 [Camellia sinensis]
MMSIIDISAVIKLLFLLLMFTLFCFDVLPAVQGLGADTVAGASSASVSGSGSGIVVGGGGGEIRSLLHLQQKGSSSSTLFNVKSFGAQANGHDDDTKAFMAAWKKACGFSGTVILLIPKGTYLIGPIKFTGPCENGYLKATTDLSKGIDLDLEAGLLMAKVPKHGLTTSAASIRVANFFPLFNLKFVAMNKTVVRGIRSLNSKFFHLALVECKNFKGSEINISAPANSPNTDGIHIERSTSVYFSRSLIGTGDDCISVGQGNSQVTVTSITCGPGHGISVGSLGRYPNEGDVRGLVVRDCTMTGTMNGIRIKTWPNSPDQSAATNMTFENIVMNNVTNPIIIDQEYCPFTSCASLAPSRVKLSDIYFKKIRGTSSSAVAVTLECSKGIPCQNIYLEDVHLDFLSGEKTATSSCRNVKVKYIGTQIPPPCT